MYYNQYTSTDFSPSRIIIFIPIIGIIIFGAILIHTLNIKINWISTEAKVTEQYCSVDPKNQNQNKCILKLKYKLPIKDNSYDYYNSSRHNHSKSKGYKQFKKNLVMYYKKDGETIHSITNLFFDDDPPDKPTRMLLVNPKEYDEDDFREMKTIDNELYSMLIINGFFAAWIILTILLKNYTWKLESYLIKVIKPLIMTKLINRRTIP